MEYRRVGNTGLRVSEVAYGSWLTFANQVELENAKEIIKKAFELGINYFDSADAYANGAAESLLGEILPRYPRSQYVVATKAFWPMSEAPTDRGLSRKHLVDSIDGSLERLKLKYVDIFYCHRWDEETPLDETLEALDDLIRMGKISYWGTSEWTADQISMAQSRCAQKGWHRPIINQPNYSLMQLKNENTILPTCIKHGMGTANFSPLAQGVLTGKYSGGRIPAGSRGSNDKINRFMKDHLSDVAVLDNVDALGAIAEGYGISIGQLSLAWILQNPGISSVIIGASSVSQIEQNAGASGIELKKEDMVKIEALFPV
jgi:voltage-dependent potassium channel beta subunit